MAGLNLFTNNAATTLASSILVGATSLTVASATGGLFPNPTGGQYFYCTLQNTAGTVVEIVKVTARSTDTFTIVRAQDNTTASAFASGDKVELRATAADLNNFAQLDSTNTFALAQTFSSPIAATSGGTSQSTYTTGDIVYASGTNTLSKLAIGTTGQALTVSGGVPAWAAAGGSTSLTTTSFTATAGQTSFTVSYTPSLLQGVYRNGVKLDPADYTASSGTAVVLSAAAALNDNIQVQFFTALSTLATPLAVSLGGTGQASNLTQYGLMYGSTTTAMATTAAGTSTQVLHGNAAGAPTWSAVSLTADVTGTLPVTNGGTGMTSATAYALLAGGTTSTGAHQSLASVGTTGQVLTSNGAGALPTFQAAAGGGGLGGMQVFTAGGTFTIPTGKTIVKVTVVGAGGGSGGYSYTYSGGGGGATTVKYLTGLTPGNTLTVTVGIAGTVGGNNNSAGGTGGTSSVASGTQTITTVSSTGGVGGSGNGATPTAFYSTLNISGGSGGSSSGGDYNIPGQLGAYQTILRSYDPGCGTLQFYYGSGGSSLFGMSISQTPLSGNSNYNGTSSFGYGSGGGPGYGIIGSAGKQGIVIFEY